MQMDWIGVTIVIAWAGIALAFQGWALKIQGSALDRKKNEPCAQSQSEIRRKETLWDIPHGKTSLRYSKQDGFFGPFRYGNRNGGR